MKKRLDVLLVDNGLYDSREKAKRAIMAGMVYINNQKFDKAGTMIAEDAEVEIRGSANKYVSRGGLKLEKAMQEYDISLDGFICADIGASTGGFTDCMLQSGASKVYAIDVGYGQLDWKLRNDERVVNMERTNVRYVTDEQVPDPLDFLSVDVSFISLKLVLPVVKKLLRADANFICLIKPQFEAGRERTKKSGVIRDKAVHNDVLNELIDFITSIGIHVENLTFSPITGPKGNIEFLARCINNPDRDRIITESAISDVVDKAHETLKK